MSVLKSGRCLGESEKLVARPMSITFFLDRLPSKPWLRPQFCRSASSSARQASMAHLTRCGNFRTPRSRRRSPKVGAPSSPLPATRSWKARSISSAAARDFPFSFIVIMEAEAWLMAQPWPLNLISAKLPSGPNFTPRSISSPHDGLSPCTWTEASGSSPKFRGFRE